jgi:alpha-N-arabinofuranosidase
LTHRSYKSSLQALGHADLVETTEGKWFAVFLGVRPNGYPPCYHLGRETFLSPLTWATDGFPVIGEHGRISPEMDTPLELHSAAEEPERDDFDSPTLEHDWNFLRNPDPEIYSLEERPGYLRLRGGAHGLDDVASPAWVGKRQCHFTVRVATSVEFAPAGEREEAGLVVRMNERHHYEIFVTQRSGRPSVVLRRRIGSLRAEVASRVLTPNESSSAVLVIDADRDKYVFSCGRSRNEIEPLGEGETRYLSTEVASGFTGVFFGIYATGNGARCEKAADFDWFEYCRREEAATP